METQRKSKSTKDFNFFYLSKQKLIKKYDSIVESESGIPEDSLTFETNFFEDSGDYGRAWVGSVTSKELIRLYQKHENKLFAGNVRLFLGEKKGSINQQIIDTAKTKSGNFWALNNGITIVTDNASVDSDNPKKLKLNRFSIVNGCQTTSCVVNAGDTNAKVLTRVIAARSGLKNEIIRYNNSQNAVKIWAVRAVDSVQNNLRDTFKKFDIQYAPKQEGLRAKKSISKIELDKVAQHLASRHQEYLIQAINNKSELFDEPYQKLFNISVKAEEVYLAWIVGSLSDTERQNKLQAMKHSGQNDLNIGLLGIAGALWIVFTVYKLMNQFSNLTSREMTVEKMKTDEFINALKKYVTYGVDLFYETSIDTYDEEYGSFKSTLRSTKFLQKYESKINSKINRLKLNSNGKKVFPDLAAVAKSIKI